MFVRATEHDAVVKELRAEIERLNKLIHTPRTDEFFEAVRIEAACQIEKWGTEHDRGKADSDWFWLLGYLAGKALASFEWERKEGLSVLFKESAHDKGLHHIITSAAAMLNWWRHKTGVAGNQRTMKPGTE